MQIPSFLCLHTLRADCNRHRPEMLCIGFCLCLHTLRADCNDVFKEDADANYIFASTRSVQIATTCTANKKRES